MGVSGSGKTTVGSALASAIGSVFLDADDFHPPENVAKMAAGIALTDDDRGPWLASIAERLTSLKQEGASFVLACSALKERYRRVIGEVAPNLIVVHLSGTPPQIRERLLARENHFMPPALLESQFEAMEAPSEGLLMDISEPVPNLVERIVSELRFRV